VILKQKDQESLLVIVRRLLNTNNFYEILKIRPIVANSIFKLIQTSIDSLMTIPKNKKHPILKFLQTTLQQKVPNEIFVLGKKHSPIIIEKDNFTIISQIISFLQIIPHEYFLVEDQKVFFVFLISFSRLIFFFSFFFQLENVFDNIPFGCCVFIFRRKI